MILSHSLVNHFSRGTDGNELLTSLAIAVVHDITYKFRRYIFILVNFTMFGNKKTGFGLVIVFGFDKTKVGGKAGCRPTCFSIV